MLKNKQKFLTIGATAVAIGATATLMQNRAGPAGPVNAATPVPISTAGSALLVPLPGSAPATPAAATLEPVSDTPAVDSPLPVPPREALMPTPLPQVGSGLQNRMATTPPAAPDNGPRRNEFGLTCGPILSATVQDAAMVSLTLTAPCRGEQNVTVSHGALSFTGTLDHLGTYMVAVPAMQAEADFEISFKDGDSVSATATVPAATEVNRAALLFKGDTGLQIHALEFGAEYNGAGHVWSGSPRDAASALKSGGGFMTLLGEPGAAALHAQVYTFPDSGPLQSGVVRLSVEAEVTALNCATEVAGQTIEPALSGGVTSVALTVAIPDCTAIGEFLVLKNLLRDLKIASN